jgi:hypothetical protein
MRIQDLIIGIIIFALFMLAILGIASSMYGGMNVIEDNDTAATLSQFETNAQNTKTNMFGVVVEMQNNSIGGSNVNVDSSKSFGDNIISSGIRVVTIASRSFGVLQSTMNTLGNAIGIPSDFIFAFYAIIVLIIIMIFASSVLYNRL